MIEKKFTLEVLENGIKTDTVGLKRVELIGYLTIIIQDLVNDTKGKSKKVKPK